MGVDGLGSSGFDRHGIAGGEREERLWVERDGIAGIEGWGRKGMVVQDSMGEVRNCREHGVRHILVELAKNNLRGCE